MAAPLYEKLKALAARDALRMHMPGHKGKLPFAPELAGAALLDYTEIETTGNLYEETPPIADAEKAAATAFGAKHLQFLTGGATQGLHSALLYAARRGKSVIMCRGCHLAVYNACGLFGLQPRYIYQETIQPFGAFGPVTAGQVEEELKKAPAAAVILTSPTYYGVISDLEAIGEVCRRHGALLIADGAHGAHLPFMAGFEKALLGADIVISSAHKTLPALGQSALMMAGENVDARELRRISSIVGTSSPSYAVMASLDAARSYMEGEGRKSFARAAETVAEMRREINGGGIFLALEGPGTDPLRLVVNTAAGGLAGFDAAEVLSQKYSIDVEMADAANLVMIITGMDGEKELARLYKALKGLEKSLPGEPLPPPPAPPAAAAARTLSFALTAPRRTVPIGAAAGETAGEQITVYPPGIPLVAAGEIIEQKHLAYLTKMRYNMNRPVEVLAV